MKRKYYIPLGILCLFVVTNPSISAFKAYIGQTDDNYKCTANYFIFSTYRWHSSYVGVLGNFWSEGRNGAMMPDTTDPFKKYGGRELTQQELDSLKNIGQ